jgi:DnaJ-class molecular chaperone
MRNKMITLCPTTYETAKKMPNFSAWVRNQLRDLEDYTPNKAKYEYTYKCPVCKSIETSPKRHARTCEKCVYIMTFVREEAVVE